MLWCAWLAAGLYEGEGCWVDVPVAQCVVERSNSTQEAFRALQERHLQQLLELSFQWAFLEHLIDLFEEPTKIRV